MAGQGKEKKSNKEDIAAVLKRLTEEVAALRADVEAVKAPPATAAALPPRAPVAKFPTDDAAGAWLALLTAIDSPDSVTIHTTADDAQVARLGYAFSSGPKVTLVRLLMEDGEQSAARLGEKAGLTTGSLYHHLRELIHAEVVVQENRNRYRLTPFGRRAALLLFALAGG